MVHQNPNYYILVSHSLASRCTHFMLKKSNGLSCEEVLVKLIPLRDRLEVISLEYYFCNMTNVNSASDKMLFNFGTYIDIVSLLVSPGWVLI